MSLWGSKDQANNAPKYKIGTKSIADGPTLYGTTVVLVDDGEVKASAKLHQPGWTKILYGRGPVTGVAIAGGGTGYANTDVVRISGGSSNALFSVVTNGSGTITTLTSMSNGAGFSNVSSLTTAVAVSNTGVASAGTGATFTVTLGGRSGRVRVETLVTLSSATANGSTFS